METLTKAVANMMPPVNLASKREDAKPNAQERALPLQTNMFSLSMRDEVPVFMYSVDVFMKVRSKAISLVKHSRDDYIVIDRKNKCRAAFRFVVRANPAVFGNPGKIYYDLQAQLFTLEKLNMDNEDEGLELVIDGADARRSTDFAEIPLDGIVVQIKRAGPKFDLALGELQLKFVAQEPKSHELLQFLEVATSQYAFLTPSDFVTYPAGLSFIKQKDPKAGTELEGGKLLLDGAQKSVRLIEGEKKTDGGGKLAVIVDAKKTAFHKTYQKVIEKVNDFGFLQSDGTVHRMRIPDLAKLLKHIYVESRYRKRTQRFLINDVNPDNARNKMFTRNGVMISVEQYYREVYNITLRYPLAPLIVSKPMKSKDSEEKMVCLFPMEVLFVCPDQRVKINQQTPRQISDMIKRCAMQPDVRVKETKNYAEKLQLNGPASQACLNYAGVSIANEVVKVSGRKLVAPEIQYKDKKIAVDSNTGTWRSSGREKPKFLVGSSLKKWAVYLLGVRQPLPDENLGRKFVMRMLEEARARGMQWESPTAVKGVLGHVDNIEKLFKAAQKEGLEFLFFIGDQKVQVHTELKFFERKYEVITQDLDLKTCRNVVEQGKFLTMENVIAKSNMKLGGVNYSIQVNDPTIKQFFKPGRLILGFQVSHAAPLKPDEIAAGVKPRVPTVVGVAGNVSKGDPACFVGDFFYQTPREDRMLEAMDTLIADFAQRYKRATGKDVAELIIYRNGASEAQYTDLVRDEIPSIRDALQSAGFRGVKLTVMVVTKLHNVRLMPVAIKTGAKASEQNIASGTVVDKGITHPKRAEFYLNGHVTLQGSAKTPKYTVLTDDQGFTLQQLERMTYALSYGHQIVSLPTSLPSPAYIAGRYAERGALIYQGFNHTVQHDADLQTLNGTLGYGKSKLGDKRVNA